jgi:hypothetical protein
MPTPRIRKPAPHLSVITPTLLLIKKHRIKPPQRCTHQQRDRSERPLITEPQQRHHAGGG